VRIASIIRPMNKPSSKNLLGISGRFCVDLFGSSLAPVAAKIYSHFIYFVKKVYKICDFNAILKDNAAINRITVQHRKGAFVSILTGMLVMLKLSHYTPRRRLGKEEI
jgi:hypothetical protein